MPQLAYPLDWPLGYKRTQNRISSSFKQTMDRAQRHLHEEVKRLGGSDLVVSTDLPVRNDGMIYAAYLDKRIDDPGVAIFFKYKKKDVTMCCDQYFRVWENIYALAKGIEALRGMDRWGVSEFLERAFTGFAALPAAGESSATKPMWYEVLCVTNKAGEDLVKGSYRHLLKKYDPINGSVKDEVRYKEVVDAYQDYQNLNK